MISLGFASCSHGNDDDDRANIWIRNLMSCVCVCVCVGGGGGGGGLTVTLTVANLPFWGL